MILLYFLPMIACLLILAGILIRDIIVGRVTRGDWLTVGFFGIVLSIIPVLNVITLFYCVCFGLEWCMKYLSKTQFWNKPIRSKK